MYIRNLSSSKIDSLIFLDKFDQAKAALARRKGLGV